jgi:hypothetical protein
MADATPTPPTSSTPSVEDLQQQIIQLQQLISSLLSQPPPTSSTTSSPPHISPSSNTSTKTIKVSPPDIFDGSFHTTDTFITQLALYFHGKKLEDDYDRIIFALSYMKGGTAGPWAKLKVKEFAKTGEVSLTWEEFLEELQRTFGDPNPANTARHKMHQLKQGSHTADEYVASFREIKDDTLYNDAALIERFEQGLSFALADKIYNLPEMPTTLDGWFSWAIKLDRQWRQREANKKSFSLFSKPTNLTPKPKPTIQPMQNSLPISPAQTTQTSKQSDVVPMEVDSGWKTIRPLICFKCRKPGHKANDCRSGVNINSMDYDSLKAYMKTELQKENSQQKEGF